MGMAYDLGMPVEFIIFLEPARGGMVDDPTPEEAALVQRHFEYLKKLTDEGVVIVAGRTTEAPHVGVVVLRAGDRANAEAIVRGDPAIDAGVFRARVSGFRVALAAGD